MSTAPLPPGHALPPVITGTDIPGRATPEPTPAPRRRRWPAFATVAVLAVGAGGTVWADLAYDSAAERFSEASDELRAVRAEAAALIDEATDTAEEAALILAADTGLLISDATRDALAATLDRAQEGLPEAAVAVSDPVPEIAAKPAWPWELAGAVGAVDVETAQAQSRTRALRSTADSLAEDIDTLTTMTAELAVEATEAAPAFEAAHLSARNSDVIELRLAHAEVGGAEPDALTDALVRLSDAATAVAASHEEKLAEKAGRLFDRRLQVEAYARSIAGGVLLEFEWQPLVNGRGDGGSAGGLATWNSSHGGYSTITLSNSVAERWPDTVMKALVTHEVGHAISAKCHHLFDWEDADANEQWATAWALSLGHTADGNGVALYGYPPQELIDTAATCR